MTLLEMRKAAGLTVPQLLDRCPIKGIDPPLVSKIEHGLANPTEALLRYAAARWRQELPETKTPRLHALASRLKRIVGRKIKLNASHIKDRIGKLDNADIILLQLSLAQGVSR